MKNLILPDVEIEGNGNQGAIAEAVVNKARLKNVILAVVSRRQEVIIVE